MENRRYLLKSRPTGMPEPGNFELEEIEIPTPTDGEVKIQARYISVDPYMRGRMRDAESYVAPFEVGEPIVGGIVAEVVESRNSDFEEGDWVMGNLPWQEEQAVTPDQVRKIDENAVPPSYYLGVLGMPGMTAYFGLLEIGQPREGETVLISAAAGAVGSVVGQIARQKGCRVVGIAGSDNKTRYLEKELHFDETINYKTTDDMQAAIEESCPDGVDVYFDNVGGPISDAVLTQINNRARMVICGQIALYNATDQPTGPRPQPVLIKKRARMEGFIVSDFSDRYNEGVKDISNWLREDKIQYKETITQGFEKLPETFIGLFHGENIGKYLVKV